MTHVHSHPEFDLIEAIRVVLDSIRDEVRRRGVRLTLSTPARALRIAESDAFRAAFLLQLVDTMQALPEGAALRIDVRCIGAEARVAIGDTAGLSVPLLSDASAATARTAMPSGGGPLAGLGVLVADDSRDAANGVAALLRLSGADAQAVFGGQAAIDASARHAFDAVVLDLDMPGVDGCEAARRIRQDAAARHVAVKLIALTGATQADDRRRAHDAGFDHHLRKPVHIDALLALLLPRPPG